MSRVALAGFFSANGNPMREARNESTPAFPSSRCGFSSHKCATSQIASFDVAVALDFLGNGNPMR
jgi:hypothetical protein